MDGQFDIDPAEFHERKRRRISTMTTAAPLAPKIPPTSAPAIHEVATFLPGRLEFEHELDNEAEDTVKDLEFGVVLAWGGDSIPEDESDPDVRGRAKWEEEMRNKDPLGMMVASINGRAMSNGLPNGIGNGYHSNGDTPKRELGSTTRSQDEKNTDGDANGDDADEQTQPPPFETQESIDLKLAVLESYFGRVDKRHENKALMFDRGLLNYKAVRPLLRGSSSRPD